MRYRHEVYVIVTERGVLKKQIKPEAMPLASFKRNCVIKHGAIKQFKR